VRTLKKEREKCKTPRALKENGKGKTLRGLGWWKVRHPRALRGEGGGEKLG